MSADALLRTPLYDAHVRLGGRIVPFAGYEMPVQYTGILAETEAVRQRVGMFDVSHMARLDIEGTGALHFLERVTSNDVSKLEDGKGQYSLLPNAEGGTVDDIIVYRLAEDRYRMVVNASNHAKDVAWLRSHDAENVMIDDVTSATCLIAVQGPQAVEVVASLVDDADAIRQAPFFGTVNTTVAGVPVFAARSGYTGEDGYEITGPADQAEALWQALLDAGVTACGLGSRDTLRVEAGLPLYGHELSDDLSPIAAGLGWVVSKTKHFIGSDKINQARADGVPRRLMGVTLGSKRLIPTGATVSVDGKVVGEVSSGVVSPTLGTAIALAFIDAEVQKGAACAVDLRGKPEPAEIVDKRFLKNRR
jgi:aminomethyltransferase